MRKILQGVIVAAALFCAMPATAGFVHQDYKVAGDNKTTLDQDTGLEWLKLSETKGLSVGQVSGQLGADGKFSGWRLPTGKEVAELLSAIFNGSEPDENSTIVGVNSTYVNSWFNWMGSWLWTNGSFYSYGLHYQSEPGEGLVVMTGVRGSDKVVYNAWRGRYSQTYKNGDVGVFLVRDTSVEAPGTPTANESDVPAPFSMIIFGFVAMLFAGRKWHKS